MPEPAAHVAHGVELRTALGALAEVGVDGGGLLVGQLAVDERRQEVVGVVGHVSASRSAARPRCRRLRTVPTGTPSWSAISA